MNRKETIKTLQQIGAEIAKELGFDDMVVREDRQKGIWGEALTKFLEEKYGECTAEIKWYSPKYKSDYVEFSFRFSSPVLSVHIFHNGMPREILGCVEFSDAEKNWDNSEYEYTDLFLPSQQTSWGGEDGRKYVDKIMAAWNQENAKKSA